MFYLTKVNKIIMSLSLLVGTTVMLYRCRCINNNQRMLIFENVNSEQITRSKSEYDQEMPTNQTM